MTKTAATRRAAQRVENNRAFRVFVRAGYAANGVVHVLIGMLALQVAFGQNASADQSGALAAVGAAPAGGVLLWAIAAATAALALFEVVELVLARGRGRDAWMERAKLGGKAVVYAGISALAATVAIGGSTGGGTASVSARVLELPGGVVLLVLLAVGVGGVGVYLAAKGIRQTFLDDLAQPRGSLRTVTTVIGTAGYVAKGVAIVVVAGFLAGAAVTSDPSKAEGLDGALTSLTQLPFGKALLVVVALGLVLFGLYCFVRARFAKL